MTRFLAISCYSSDALSQDFHCLEGVVVAKHFRRKGPDVAQRHRAKAPGNSAGGSFDNRMHVEERDAINGHSAELKRSAIMKVFVIKGNFADANVGWLRGHDMRLLKADGT